MTTRTIGFIGLGIMGKPMARNLAKAGYELVIHNRSRAAVDELLAEGPAFSAASSPREVAERADIVITMLPDSPDVKQVVFGENGLLPALGPDHLLIDMSTIAPATRRFLASSTNDATTGACATSGAPPRSSSKYARHSPSTLPGSARYFS